MRRFLLLVGLTGTAAIIALVVHNSSLFVRSDRARGEPTFSSSRRENSQREKVSKQLPVPVAAMEEPASLTEARNDPDPAVRLNAIEAWARHPTDSLDPLTYALVDADEQVRARAQELLEQALARR